MLFLGIDQHARQLTVSLRNEDGDVILARQVSTQPDKVNEFFQRLTRERLRSDEQFVAVLEVCGFNDWLIRMLEDYRCHKVILIQPEDRQKRKTDRRDAAALSEVLWVNRGRLLEGKPVRGLRVVDIASPINRENRRLTTLRKEARQARTRVINKIKQILRQHNLIWHMPTKTFPTLAAIDWLKKLVLPAIELRQFLFTFFGGCAKNPHALDTGGGACCYNRRHFEPGVVPDNSKWEIPVKGCIPMSSTTLRVVLALWLGSTLVPLADTAEPDQGSAADRIVGSTTARTAGQGYSQSETRRHLANFDHRRWDVKDDETKRFVHINGPQLFTHAWVHRAGPISTLQTNIQPQIGNVKASKTPIGKIILDKWIADGTVDGYLVLHRGQIVFEQYPRMRPFDKHHWMSVRKGLVGTVIAMLEDEGQVDVKLAVENYIPELKKTAWAGVPVIDILDMASGTSGVEWDDPDAFTSEASRYYQYEASVGNRPHTVKTVESTYEYVASLPRRRPNGEANEYTTVNTFVLTWLAEKVTGKPFAEVVSEKIWRKIGAESDAVMMVSSVGASSTINSTLRDMGRFGLLFTPSWRKVSEKRLVSDAYLKKIQHGGRPEIFAKAGAGKMWMKVLADDPPRHNTYQWDFVMPDGDFFKAGMNGQGLYISASRDVVVAFFGSGDNPSVGVSLRLARAITKSFK